MFRIETSTIRTFAFFGETTPLVDANFVRDAFSAETFKAGDFVVLDLTSFPFSPGAPIDELLTHWRLAETAGVKLCFVCPRVWIKNEIADRKRVRSLIGNPQVFVTREDALMAIDREVRQVIAIAEEESVTA